MGEGKEGRSDKKMLLEKQKGKLGEASSPENGENSNSPKPERSHMPEKQKCENPELRRAAVEGKAHRKGHKWCILVTTEDEEGGARSEIPTPI